MILAMNCPPRFRRLLVFASLGILTPAILPQTSPAAHDGADWNEIFTAIGRGRRRVVILNHPRDIHSGFRPFDPQRHVAIAGENLDGWKLEANAMELVNSGALQSDGQRLIADWFGLLNAGFKIAPVGSSDSHDVSRSIVGQARTYVRCRDADAGMIDAGEAVDNFLAGRVLVSFGLAADVLVMRCGSSRTRMATQSD